MRELTVLYDAQCGLCRRFKDWLAAQRPGPMVQAAAGLRRLSGGDYADRCDGECDRQG